MKDLLRWKTIRLAILPGLALVLLMNFGPFCFLRMKCLSTDEMVTAALDAPVHSVGIDNPEFLKLARQHRSARPTYLPKYEDYRRGIFGETRVSITRAKRYNDGSVNEEQVVARVSRCGHVSIFPEVMGLERYDAVEAWLQSKEPVADTRN